MNTFAPASRRRAGDPGPVRPLFPRASLNASRRVFRLAAALSLMASFTTPSLLRSETDEARPSSADARFVSQDVPEVIPAGETRQVSLTFFNSGDVTWDPEYGYSLGNIGDDLAWRVARVNIGVPVPPGNSETFSFDITAPVIPGNYRFQWSLARDGDSGNRGVRLFNKANGVRPNAVTRHRNEICPSP